MWTICGRGSPFEQNAAVLRIPRNAFRGTADAFAYDEAACCLPSIRALVCTPFASLCYAFFCSCFAEGRFWRPPIFFCKETVKHHIVISWRYLANWWANFSGALSGAISLPGVVSDALLRGSFASSCCAAELLCAVQPLVHAEGPGDSRTQLGMRILRENMQRFPDEVSKMIFQAGLAMSLASTILWIQSPHRLTHRLNSFF